MYNDYRVKPLHEMISKISAYVKSYGGQTKWMYFLIEADNLLEKYSTIWGKVNANVKKEFDSERVYSKNFLKTKIKFYGDVVRNFYDKEIPKVDSYHTCLAVINFLNYYYPQMFLKACKYFEKKGISHLNDKLSNFSSTDDSDEE